MNIKKAMLIFPSNVLICYDLYIIDFLNRFHSKIDEAVWKTCVDKLLSIFNGNIVETPLHKLLFKNNRLILVDLMTEKESNYYSINKFIYGKSRFITIDVYEYLIQNGYKDMLKLGTIDHKNVNCNTLLEQYNNFIVYDNRNWDEKHIIKSVYGGEENQYIDRDKLMEWFDSHINTEENNGLELTLVSDAFDIDRELGAECYHTLGMNKSRFIQVELRMCCLNSENLRRYNETEKTRNFYRSSIGLYKMWDTNMI